MSIIVLIKQFTFNIQMGTNRWNTRSFVWKEIKMLMWCPKDFLLHLSLKLLLKL